ncbi:hypothetical protein ACKKBF_B20370 [Auxenochlorella protothecoides x Auxenochlorella symbiontica]
MAKESKNRVKTRDEQVVDEVVIASTPKEKKTKEKKEKKRKVEEAQSVVPEVASPVVEPPKKKKRKASEAETSAAPVPAESAPAVKKKSKAKAAEAAASPVPVTKPAAPAAVSQEKEEKKKKKKKKAEAEASAAMEKAAPVETVGAPVTEEKRKKKKKGASVEDSPAGTALPAAGMAEEPEPLAPGSSTRQGIEEMQAVEEAAPRQGTAAKAFQRVKAEEWIDKRGSWDNSYVGTFGEQGWGFKAQQILGQVRGKDFRHEKTKKKRGSYKGGLIDSHTVSSYKFDSDGE